MRWHDLLAGLDGPGRELERGSGRRGRAPSPTTAAASRPARCFACIPGAGHRRARLRAPRRSRAGAVALLVERPLAARRSPQARVPERARARSARSRPASTATRRARCACLGVTGTNGKTTTTYLLEAIARARGRARRRDRHRRRARRRATPSTAGAHHARGDRPPGAARARCATRACGTVAMEVSSHALDQHRVDGTRFAAVCFTNLSPRPPRLPRHARRVLRGEGAAVRRRRSRRRAAVNVDDAHGARARARARRAPGSTSWTYARRRRRRRRRRATDVELGATARAFALVDRRDGRRRADRARRSSAVQRRERARGRGHRARRRLRRSTRSPPGSRGPSSCPAGSSGSTRASRSPCSSTTPTRPTRSARVLAAARALAGAGGRVIVVFGCGGDRDRGKRPLMGAAVGRGADLAVVTSDNPRSEDPQAIAAEVLAGLRRRPRPCVVELDRRAAIARRARRRAAPATSCVIAGKGHETGQTDRRRHRAVRRPRRRARGAGGARMELTAAELAARHRRRGRRRRRPTRARTSFAIDSRVARAGRVLRRAAWPSATATTSSPTRSRAARRVALVDRVADHAARRGRRGRAGRRPARRARGASARAARRGSRDATVVGVTGSAGKTAHQGPHRGRARRRLARAREPGVVQQRGRAPAHAARARRRTPRRWCSRWARASRATSPTLCAIARPTVGVVTNVGLAHAEHLGGREGIARVKGELLEALAADGARGARRRRRRDAAGSPRRTAARVLRGRRRGRRRRRRGATTSTLDAELRPRFALESPWGSGAVALAVRGAHQVANAALAAAVALALGVPLDDGRRRARRGRARRRGGWRCAHAPTACVVLNDAYNANPSSMAAALRVARARSTSPGGGSRCSARCASSATHSDAEHAALGDLVGAARHRRARRGRARGGAARRRARERPGVARHRGRPTPPTRARRGRARVVQPGDAVLVKAQPRRRARAWSPHALRPREATPRDRAPRRRRGRVRARASSARRCSSACCAREGIGQQIRDDGPFAHPHVAKAGTPTMGGIAIVGERGHRLPRRARPHRADQVRRAPASR